MENFGLSGGTRTCIFLLVAALPLFALSTRGGLTLKTIILNSASRGALSTECFE